MKDQKTAFALFFGSRGFFPSSLIAGAREEMARQIKSFGHNVLMLDAKATRHGAVETPREGKVYAEFLRRNRGKFGGIILCLPNFGDETGAVAALKDADVPILIQAYPDETDKMAPALRRDAFCGKISIMDVFSQYGVKFTALKPHTISPLDGRFQDNIEYFDRLCRVVNGVHGMTLGAVGARTTPFKTVRYDELALQRHGITVETFDLSGVIDRMTKLSPRDKALRAKALQLKKLSDWRGVPARSFDNLARLGVVLDSMIEEYDFNALTVRCWTEMQTVLGISPCVLMSILNENSNTPCACEVDVGNAVAMRALGCASGKPVACLDWNNNYEDDDNKCILFHCGPVPSSMMTTPGRISDHAILANAVGKGKGFGCREGRIAPTDFTFGSLAFDSGRLKFYAGEGRFTNDEIAEDYFGCAGVAEIENLQDVLLHVGREGHRHHVSVTPSRVMAPVREALGYYLGFDVTTPQHSRTQHF